MIRRIETIRDFGIFRDFNGRAESGLPPFARFNLIYGWNYSGKTTLARVFRAMERKSLDRFYQSAKFAVTLDDGTTLTSKDLSRAPQVKVFNRDFVDMNFQAEDAAPAVFILGEENADLKSRLSWLARWENRIHGIEREQRAQTRREQQGLDSSLTDSARNLGELLGVRNFRRPDLERRIDEVKANPHCYTLSEDQVDGHVSTFRDAGDFQEINPVAGSSPDIAVLVGNVNALLSQTASHRAAEDISADPTLESWVRAGIKLHEDSSTCRFCGQTMPQARLEVLRGHFSDAYERLLAELDSMAAHLSGIVIDIGVPDETRLIPSLRAGFAAARTRLVSWQDWARTTRDSLSEALKKKQRNVEDTSTWNGDLGKTEEIDSIIAEVNDAISRHNDYLLSLDHAKEESRLALERHFAAAFFVDHQVAKRTAAIQEHQALATRCEHARNRLTSEATEIEAKIRGTSIGADRLNALLSYLLAGCNIAVQSDDDVEFRFLRDGQPAVNLSDGEKTAVTFAYYLIRLEAQGVTPAETVVFIDDPISSLDSNHVYAVYALICRRLKECKQVFVSTHNSEFFNLLKDEWLGRRGGNGEESGAFYIFRSISEDGRPEAKLIDLPQLLRRFKSEYEFIFWHLFRFSTESAPSQRAAYSAPNFLRKFLEAYLGFRKPAIKKWSNKLDLLFDSEEQRLEIAKFCDDESHLQSLGRTLQQPDFVVVSQGYVQAVMKALASKDSAHYQSLVATVEDYDGV